MLRSERTSLAAAVAETLAAIPADPRDAAVRRLIERYADALDADAELDSMGSKLLSALESLQATPRARRAQISGETGPSRLDAFLGRQGA